MKTIHIPDDLHLKVKIQAAKDGVPVQNLVEAAIIRELAKRRDEQRASKRGTA